MLTFAANNGFFGYSCGFFFERWEFVLGENANFLSFSKSWEEDFQEDLSFDL